MLKELSEVTSRPKFRHAFTHQRKKELFSLLDSYAIVVSPKQKVNACREKKDNFLLEIALEGKAKYLVTGDEDLLVLKTFYSTKIIEPKEFEDILKSGKE